MFFENNYFYIITHLKVCKNLAIFRKTRPNVPCNLHCMCGPVLLTFSDWNNLVRCILRTLHFLGKGGDLSVFGEGGDKSRVALNSRNSYPHTAANNSQRVWHRVNEALTLTLVSLYSCGNIASRRSRIREGLL